jgi:hypothetical protein
MVLLQVPDVELQKYVNGEQSFDLGFASEDDMYGVSGQQQLPSSYEDDDTHSSTSTTQGDAAAAANVHTAAAASGAVGTDNGTTSAVFGDSMSMFNAAMSSSSSSSMGMTMHVTTSTAIYTYYTACTSLLILP